MVWVALVILVVIGFIIYSKRKGTVTLTKDQAELAMGLIRKELTEIENNRQKIIDDAAAEGKSVPIDSIFSKIESESDELVKRELEKQKHELLNKYGPNIPVDVVYRLMKQWAPDEESPWSDNPGCFERHLQRREGNLLFLPERRVITKKDIDEAKERDRIEQQKFTEKVISFRDRMKAMGKETPPAQANIMLGELQELIEEAAAIEGDIGHFRQALENSEEALMQLLIKSVPDAADKLKLMQSYSMLKRFPYMAQRLRKDTPILKEEEIPALLSEDIETISFAGYLSRAFAPDYRPSEVDIRNYLEEATRNGFSKDRAAEIIAAWNETNGE